MTQSQLDQAVAQATGECVSTIESLGFRLLGDPALESESWLDEHVTDQLDQPSTFDWDTGQASPLSLL